MVLGPNCLVFLGFSQVLLGDSATLFSKAHVWHGERCGSRCHQFFRETDSHEYHEAVFTNRVYTCIYCIPNNRIISMQKMTIGKTGSERNFVLPHFGQIQLDVRLISQVWGIWLRADSTIFGLVGCPHETRIAAPHDSASPFSWPGKTFAEGPFIREFI